jgi:apolipoprotein N-acyltransferase
LRRQGAELIVLPEKIAVLNTQGAQQAQQRLSTLAVQLSVWLEAGVAVQDGNTSRNLAWLFAPDGQLQQNYQKQILAPGERNYQRGEQLALQTLSGIPTGIAISGDMHFPDLSRSYANAGAALILVPAWDFGVDAKMVYQITMLRGIENGFSIIRNAREGWLSVSDAYGRQTAFRQSAAFPGNSFYTQIAIHPADRASAAPVTGPVRCALPFSSGIY